MAINSHEDTSYKYRWNQKELLGKVISGTLDEDLYISGLRITSNKDNDWFHNPVFSGRCFANPHKIFLHAIIDYENPQVSFKFQNSKNITEIIIEIDYAGRLEYINHSIAALGKEAADLERLEIRVTDKIRISDTSDVGSESPKLTTMIIRASRGIPITGETGFLGPNVDTVVLDSPILSILSNVIYFTSNSNVFASGGTGGTIYIPKSLYDHLGDGSEYDYKAATNWSTIDSYGTITWAQIEGSEYEL